MARGLLRCTAVKHSYLVSGIFECCILAIFEDLKSNKVLVADVQPFIDINEAQNTPDDKVAVKSWAAVLAAGRIPRNCSAVKC